MEFDDFNFQYQRLARAFTVSRAEERLSIYFEELQKIDLVTFTEAVRRSIRDGERFPTIAHLIKTCDAICPPSQRSKENCPMCDGTGQVSLWAHTFRTRCRHGKAQNNAIAFEPATENERFDYYSNLQNEWKSIYGKEFPYPYLQNPDF